MRNACCPAVWKGRSVRKKGWKEGMGGRVGYAGKWELTEDMDHLEHIKTADNRVFGKKYVPKGKFVMKILLSKRVFRGKSKPKRALMKRKRGNINKTTRNTEETVLLEKEIILVSRHLYGQKINTYT